MIGVTKTFLPPIEEYQTILKRAWDINYLTNRGELVKEMEVKLEKLFSIPHCLAVANATLGLQLAIKSLQLKGQIITTPFTYIATASSIVWENCQPVFVDIEPNYLCIDVNKVEAAINRQTSAILVTHVFGNPCDVISLELLAQKYNLKIIYDAAHAFGVQHIGKSLLSFGDISICSFHATKIFHTGEGGAIFCKSQEVYEKIFNAHNFGHQGYEEFNGLGINGKMSELQAAMGLTILPYMQDIIAKRKEIYNLYFENLKDIEGISMVPIRLNTDWNYSYCPLLFDNEDKLLLFISICAIENILPRRYFYPSLNTLSFLNPSEAPISEDIASRILCLPLHTYLMENDVIMIVNILRKTLIQ